MKGEIKRDRSDFFPKNVSEPSHPPDELAQNVSKKNPRRTIYSSIFSAKVQNLAVFPFIYMLTTCKDEILFERGVLAVPTSPREQRETSCEKTKDLSVRGEPAQPQDDETEKKKYIVQRWWNPILLSPSKDFLIKVRRYKQ